MTPIARPSRRRRAERGFTLVELMFSLLVSSLLVILIFAIFSRMSTAYRSQQEVANVQQVLTAARNVLTFDAQRAGLGMSQGFMLANGQKYSPVQITNSNTGPDTLALFSADPSTQAAVISQNWPTSITVDSAVGFTNDEVVVLSTADTATTANPLSASDAKIATFSSCVVQINTVSGGVVTFKTSGTWGNPGNTHCLSVGVHTMMYKFSAKAYRLDPTVGRLADGVLQMSPSGGLVASDWQDLGFGFTDLQIATYFFEEGDAVDSADPDSDPLRDWASGALQATRTAPLANSTLAFTPPLVLSISLVSRTDRDVDGVGTAFTPLLTDTANVDANMIGDRDVVDLATTVDARLTGNRLYRYTTFRVDLRNMGIGR